MPLQPVIQIPKPAWSDIRTLLDITTDDLARIAGFVCNTAPTPDIEDIADACAKSLQLPSESIESVLSVAISLKRLQRELDKPTKHSQGHDVLSLVAATLKREGFSGWDDDVWEQRKPFLHQLLAVDGPIDIMAKARELLYEFQCVLRDCGVTTDVRYLYNNDASDVVGGLVLHTLRLQYMEGYDLREIHITLSNEDIEALVYHLDRAKQKSQRANSLLETAKLPELTPKRNLR